MFIGPILLTFLVVGFLGISATIPLIAICAGIVAAIGLGVAAYTSYWRYDYLTKKANELLSQYEVTIAQKIPELDKITSNQIIFVINGATVTAYFKRLSSPVGVDLRLTPEEFTLLNNQIQSTNDTNDTLDKAKLTTDQQLQLYGILQNALSAQATSSNGVPDLSSSEKNIVTWEKVNAFLSDAISAFAFVFIIIFLITHVVSGIWIPFGLSLVVAGIVALLYGLVSAKVKDRQVEVKLQQMHALEVDYQQLQTDVNVMQVKLKNWGDEAHQATTNLNDDDNDPKLVEIRTLAESIKAMVQTYQGQLTVLRQNLADKQTTLGFAFTDRDKFRVGYALFYGSSVMGSFLCTGFVAFLGLTSALAIPVVWIGLIVGMSLLYGAFHAYYKYQSIRREKWSVMKEDSIISLQATFDAVKAQEKSFEAQVNQLGNQRDTLLQSERKAKGNLATLSPEELKEATQIINFRDPLLPQHNTQSLLHQFNSLLGKKKRPVVTELNDMGNTPTIVLSDDHPMPPQERL